MILSLEMLKIISALFKWQVRSGGLSLTISNRVSAINTNKFVLLVNLAVVDKQPASKFSLPKLSSEVVTMDPWILPIY